MKRQTPILWLALGALMTPIAAHADWAGKGEAGLVLARGNTDATTLSAKVDATRTDGDFANSLGFALLRASTAGVQSADRYDLHGQSTYKLSDRSYAIGNLRYENDKFSSFAYQATAAAGLGYKFLDSADTKLSGELGVGYRRSKDRTTDAQQGDGIVRGAVNFEHSFSASTKVLDKLLVESGSSDTGASNDLALQVKMSDRLALSLDYTIRHHTHVGSPLIKKTDQLTTANLVFAF